MKITNLIQIPALALLVLFGCSSNSTKEQKTEVVPTNFNDYWYGGLAEISSYKLKQARYGEIHEGNAVLIYVTEPFSKEKGAKLDNSTMENPGIPVLKLNFTKKFNTGIYPYSMMTSIFTPVDIEKNPHSLKTTTSSQEWCGHTFTSLLLRDEYIKLSIQSYFENESLSNERLPIITTEDELWTRIRINPKSIKTGKIQLIPSTMFLRLKHVEMKPYNAEVSIANNGNIETLSIIYPELNRSIKIHYHLSFPHEILSWEDTYKSGWGSDAKTLTTVATKMKDTRVAYWSKNSNTDRKLYENLGLKH
ncbi:MAG: hypothetical protein ACJAZ3_000721 [Sphingobacteriales bacterium]|jgi:hypothetical protein